MLVMLQYIHLNPAPVDQTSARAWLYKHSSIAGQNNKLNPSMTEEACKSKLRSVVCSFMHPSPGNWVEVRRTVVYYTRALSAGIKCLHCSWLIIQFHINESGFALYIEYHLLLMCWNHSYTNVCYWNFHTFENIIGIKKKWAKYDYSLK